MKAKLNVRTKAVTVALSCLMLATPAISSASGIPVFDGAAAANALQSLIQMKQQIDNQIKQITELKSQVKALTGTRNLGNILKTEAYEQLPDEWKPVYNSASTLKNGNYKDLLSAKNYNPSADSERLVQQFDLTLKAIKDSEVRMDNIKRLMDQVNQTQDMKAAADLQSRIALENAKIQQNQTNLDMMARFMDIQEKVQVQQRQNRDSCLRQNRINGTSHSCG